MLKPILNVTSKFDSITVYHSNGRTERIKVRYSPIVMHKKGKILACATSNNEIIVDDIFIKLIKSGNKDICKGLLAHEVGHIMNGDLSLFEYARKHGKITNNIHMDIIQEHNADIYAYNINKHNALAMLRYLYEIHKTANVDVTEIKDRYKMIASLSY